MRAVVVNQPGGPEELTVQDRPDPTPGPGDVVVDAEAIGVNFLDVSARSGQRPTAFPFIPGHEGAGTVSAVGPDVDGFVLGDRVAWAWSGVSSSYAERVVIPAQWLLPLPDGINADIAAAVLIQGMTAHYLSHQAYPINLGDTVLIHAGAGGVGLLLTQLAKWRGARVITTVSTVEKERLSRDNGADDVIRYTETDFADQVATLTAGHGVAAIYDGVGAATFDADLTGLAPRGVLVIYGQASGPIPPFETARLIAAGSVYLTRTSLTHYARTPTELQALAGEVLALAQSGTLRVHLGGRYPLSEAGTAHQQLQDRRSVGKLILIP